MTEAGPIVVADSDIGSSVSTPIPASGVKSVACVPDGEVVILRLKPHPLFIVLSVMWQLVWCVVLAWGTRWISGRQVDFGPGKRFTAPNLGGLWVAIAVFGLGIVAWQTLEWWAREYLLTDRRMVRIGGVLRRWEVDIPLPRVQQVMMQRLMRERVTGLGTLGVSSAASGGLSYVFWVMIADPHTTMKVVRETVEKYGGQGRCGPTEGGTGT